MTDRDERTDIPAPDSAEPPERPYGEEPADAPVEDVWPARDSELTGEIGSEGGGFGETRVPPQRRD